MSTDHQRYSLRNQAAEIAKYATDHGIEITRTYKDAGKSGVTMRGRDGLKALLSDVLKTDRDFTHILVLDVSRWGRFQDPDQAAHYEFLCREAGVSVTYCAEPFEDDGSAMTGILKVMKRVMAGEYSRELSHKVSFAQARAAERGFKQGGAGHYGFRRQLVGPNGQEIGILGPGQRKSLQEHRVRFSIGPDHEVRTVRRIFNWRVRDGLAVLEIARRLAAEHTPNPERGTWTHATVRGILHNELVIGNFVHGRSRNVLGSAHRAIGIPIRTRVLPPIISKKMFAAAARITAGYYMTPQEILVALRRHIAERNGRISSLTISACDYLPCPMTIAKRFGSLNNAYRLVGYTQEDWRRRPHHPTKTYTDEQIVFALRAIVDLRGYVSSTLINEATTLPSSSYLNSRYGGLPNLYRIAGLPFTRKALTAAACARRNSRLPAKRRLFGRELDERNTPPKPPTDGSI